MNRYRVTHITRYEYEAPVVHAHHLAYLRPRELQGQELIKARKSTSSRNRSTRDQRRATTSATSCDEIEILSAHDLFEVTAPSVVEVSRTATSTRKRRRRLRLGASSPSVLREDPYLLCVREYCFDSPLIRLHARARELRATSFTQARPLGRRGARASPQRINDEFTYDPTVTDVSTPLARVLRYKRGVCQDFAHLAIGCLRSLGLAARYVSGYLETEPPARIARAWSAPMRRTPGRRSTCRTTAGSTSTRPTTSLPSDRHITLA